MTILIERLWRLVSHREVTSQQIELSRMDSQGEFANRWRWGGNYKRGREPIRIRYLDQRVVIWLYPNAPEPTAIDLVELPTNRIP